MLARRTVGIFSSDYKARAFRKSIKLGPLEEVDKDYLGEVATKI